MQDESLKQFTEHVREIWEQKAVVDNIKDRLAEESKKLEGLKKDAIKVMEAGEIEKFNVPGFGTVSRQKKFSVRVPKDLASKLQLFDYIKTQKGEDVLQSMVSVNSATLNSFYKEERDEAVKRGDIDWTIPGLSEPDIYFQLGMRKG